VQVNKERLDHWVGKGAQMSNSVRTLVARHLTPPPAPKPVAEAAAQS
jgi:ribosomal protein S16